MKLVCLSDSHNLHKKVTERGPLPEGDVLLHGGDFTGRGSFKEVASFLAWFASQPHQYKVFIAGNHDYLFEKEEWLVRNLLEQYPSITYLQDSGCEIGGLRFWGSPWQPWFCDWAFNLPRKGPALREKWNQIPVHTDVLITHGPPFGTLDQVGDGEHLGCEELAIRLTAVRPRVHLFGHIHDGYGLKERDGTCFVNACVCDEDYRVSNPPIVLEVDP